MGLNCHRPRTCIGRIAKANPFIVCSATIEDGRVTVYSEPRISPRAPRESGKPIVCSACRARGLAGLGHNSRNPLCPAKQVLEA